MPTLPNLKTSRKKKVVEQYKGERTFESQSGKGTTFRITILRHQDYSSVY
ncbi:MAG TPA: hypothetical protein VII11_10455 [Bacteroidota bacterium]